MRALIQRVQEATVSIAEEAHSKIGKGLLVLLGIESDDTEEDVLWLTGKVAKIRIFDDGSGHMNLSLSDIDGEMLVVSQFLSLIHIPSPRDGLLSRMPSSA